MNRHDDYIAGWKRASDWYALKQELTGDGRAGAWGTAFDEYFLARLNARYLDPIKTLREHGTFAGEGFSILTILCALIEFLETTVQGLKYKVLRRGETLDEYEYSFSSDVFVSFLCNRPPFERHFDHELATEFYRSIRCGLMHEAQTKNGWKVWAKSQDGELINRDKKIVFRDNFHDAVLAFIADYQRHLPQDPALQAAFIRKFDSLCE